MEVFDNRETAIDLSDEALWAGAGAGEEEPSGAAAPAETAAPPVQPAGAAQTILAVDGGQSAAPAQQPEALWRAAAEDIDRHWPEAGRDMPALVRKMTEISARYGDPKLWQRQPAGLMREAALELYGPPRAHTEDLVEAAMQAGRRAALAEAEARHQAKLGAAPGRPGAATPPPLNEDEQLIRAMAASRSRGIFY